MFHGFRCARTVVTAIALALFAVSGLLASVRAAACDVRLNEICPAPARDWDGNALFSARDDEWIELVNALAVAVDLSRYLISDADSTIRWAGVGTLLPGGRITIYGTDAVNWQRAVGRTIAGFSLANAGDAALLWRIDGADTTVIDSYAYKPHEAGSDRSIGRMPDGSGAWTLFDGLNPYTGTLDPQGNGCNPTPSHMNACGSTAAEASTWGRVKSAYR